METGTLEQRYLVALRRLRKTVGYIEEMARWKEDLASRLWRARATLKVTGEAQDDIVALEVELRRFQAVSAKLKEWLDAGKGVDA